MEAKRDLVFLYNGVEMTDETVLNVPVELPLPVLESPRVADFIHRKRSQRKSRASP